MGADATGHWRRVSVLAQSQRYWRRVVDYVPDRAFVRHPERALALPIEPLRTRAGFSVPYLNLIESERALACLINEAGDPSGKQRAVVATGGAGTCLGAYLGRCSAIDFVDDHI